MRKSNLLWKFSILQVSCFVFLSLSCDWQPTGKSGETNSSKELGLLIVSETPSELDTTNLIPVLAKDTKVLLRVDIENITEENYEDTVEIYDDRSDSSEVSHKPSEHVAIVEKNMKIYWSAEALDPQSDITVDVLGIFRKPEGGAEILEGVFRDPNKDGIIMGKIKDKKVEGLEFYNIMIRINEETPRTFIIDPKLQMM